VQHDRVTETAAGGGSSGLVPLILPCPKVIVLDIVITDLHTGGIDD
jgi:hypothetical protein